MRNPAECTLPRSVKGAVELGILLRCYPIGRLHDSGRAVRATTSNNKAVPPGSGIDKKNGSTVVGGGTARGLMGSKVNRNAVSRKHHWRRGTTS